MSPLPPPACGTASGYKRHRRIGEQACEPCLAANAAYNQGRRHPSPAAQLDVLALRPCGACRAYVPVDGGCAHWRPRAGAAELARARKQELARVRRAAQDELLRQLRMARA